MIRTVSAEICSMRCSVTTGLELMPNGAANRMAKMQDSSVISIMFCAKIIKKHVILEVN